MTFATVFYDGQFLLEFETRAEFVPWTRAMCNGDYTVYSNAFVFRRGRDDAADPWFRMDGTPFQTSHVPKEIRALALLMQ